MKGQTWVKSSLEGSSHGKIAPFLLKGRRRGSVSRTQRELEPWQRFPGRNWDPEVIGQIKEQRGRKTLVSTLLLPAPPPRLLDGWDLGKCSVQGPVPCERQRRSVEGRADKQMTCLISC